MSGGFSGKINHSLLPIETVDPHVHLKHCCDHSGSVRLLSIDDCIMVQHAPCLFKHGAPAEILV